VVVYLSYSTSVPGDSVTVPGAQCGGVTSLSSHPIACTTDSNGQINVTYTASASPPGQGLVDIMGMNAASGASIVAHLHYVYCTVYRFSPSPVAASGSLSAGASVVTTVSAEDALNALLPNSAVYLAFNPASGGGHAAVGSAALTTTPTLYHVDGTGHLQVTYTAPTPLPSTGVDSIVVQDKPSSPSSQTLDSYAFAAATPVISIGDTAAVEADVKPGIPLRNTLTLSSPQPNPVTVQYTTQCGVGDKTCSEDFHEVHSPLTVTFPANTTHAVVIVRAYSYVGSFGGETYNEGYFVHLSSPSGAILGRSVGAAMILPDVESSLAQTLYVGDSSLVPVPGINVLVGFTVTLLAPQSGAVTFTYATSNGSAVAGVDYAAASGTGTIPAGSNSTIVYVNWLGQAPPASNKSFSLTISNATGGPTIARATGTGTILAG
jgi:chitinase